MEDRSKDIVHVSVWRNELYRKKKKMDKRPKECSEKSNIYLIEVSEGEEREMGKKMLAKTLNPQV